MASFKFRNVNIASLRPSPIPRPRILLPGEETTQLIDNQVRAAEIEATQSDSVLEISTSKPVESSLPRPQLSRLVDDSFPFDEHQRSAIDGIGQVMDDSESEGACLTGDAGTGKTTTTKAVVDRVQTNLSSVNMQNYWKSGQTDSDGETYEAESTVIPSVVLCAFTGQATQMIKKNFPKDWHGNIMTIHRMLGFMPEWYEEYSDELSEFVQKMRFSPTYGKNFRLPWDIIVIDEAGMLGLELWHQIRDALKPGCKIIMIGDINQLPPVHGRSVFGFAMGKWPTWHLKEIHRQVGVNNSIVENAHRIINGVVPVSDVKIPGFNSNADVVTSLNALIADSNWKFAMGEIPMDSQKASVRVRQVLQLLKDKLYVPERDTVITPINGHDDSKGYALGQLPLNRELALVFNRESVRYIIDGGRTKQYFAVGDKVMATKNDWDSGITNGMTGIIEDITRNAGYAGEWQRFGPTTEVEAYMREITADSEDDDFSLDDLKDNYLTQDEIREIKEKKDRGPASHTVTIKFGEGGGAFSQAFGTLSEVGSLATAYVVTCHKMQGGQAPLIVIIVHDSHKFMMYREWFYTAVTRASSRCLVLHTKIAIKAACHKQRIKGKNLQEKIAMFTKLSAKGLLGAAVHVNLHIPRSLDEAESVGDEVIDISKIGGEEDESIEEDA